MQVLVCTALVKTTYAHMVVAVKLRDEAERHLFFSVSQSDAYHWLPCPYFCKVQLAV